MYHVYLYVGITLEGTFTLSVVSLRLLFQLCMSHVSTQPAPLFLSLFFLFLLCFFLYTIVLSVSWYTLSILAALVFILVFYAHTLV